MEYTFSNISSDHTIQASFAPSSMQFVITATAGKGGTISPSGDVIVNYGSSQTFTITPDPNYHILDVLVDDVSVGRVSTYTFENITSYHTIEAVFRHDYFKTTSPLGDETFSPTDKIHVTWHVEGFTGTEGKIRILFYPGGGGPYNGWYMVTTNLDLADGSYDIDTSLYPMVDPLRCRVRIGIYNPSTGAWLIWTDGTHTGQYYDESGHFWIVN